MFLSSQDPDDEDEMMISAGDLYSGNCITVISKHQLISCKVTAWLELRSAAVREVEVIIFLSSPRLE